MFTSVRFRNFKCLRDFTVHLRHLNVLVGPNNSGKSTILDAFRALAVAHTFASRRNPTIVSIGSETVEGYEIPTSNFPISLANIHSDYRTDEETSITFAHQNGNKLRLVFYDNFRCILIPEETPRRITNTKYYRQYFPVSIPSFPTLGPLEEEEDLLTEEYFQRWHATRRAHRMFRNLWHRRKDEFPRFKKLIEESWPGITVSPPERTGYNPPRLTMFCTEGRIDRELCWAGFGFQVWLQIITHFMTASDATLLIVDEPEIYLHPDLQHKPFQLLRFSGKQLILATHSAEIINEAEHDDLVLVNRTRRTARRITDIDGLQQALSSIGSDQNIHLSRLSRERKILFLEGNDYRVLRRFAVHCGFSNLADGLNVSIIPIGGFTQRQRIEDVAWTFEKVLRTEVAIAALLDRDYRCNEEIREIVATIRSAVPHFHILGGKEIENFLLIPEAIARSIDQRLRDRSLHDAPTASPEWVSQTLLALSDKLKSDVLSQRIAHRMRFFSGRTSKDAATIANETIALLDDEWASLDTRMLVVPGKRLLSMLNTHLQQTLRISITPTQIIRSLSEADLNAGLVEILPDLDRFSANQPESVDANTARAQPLAS